MRPIPVLNVSLHADLHISMPHQALNYILEYRSCNSFSILDLWLIEKTLEFDKVVDVANNWGSLWATYVIIFKN